MSYILFSYHLKLGHNEDAYVSMMSNPDQSRRKDSLRQFLVTLFDRGELCELAGYPYTDLIGMLFNSFHVLMFFHLSYQHLIPVFNEFEITFVNLYTHTQILNK